MIAQKHIFVTIKVSMHTWFNKMLEGKFRIICDWSLGRSRDDEIFLTLKSVSAWINSWVLSECDQQNLIRSCSQECIVSCGVSDRRWMLLAHHSTNTLSSGYISRGESETDNKGRNRLESFHDILISLPLCYTDKLTLFPAFFSSVKRGQLKTSWQPGSRWGDRDTVNMKTWQRL